jgi:hypothetical protein
MLNAVMIVIHYNAVTQRHIARSSVLRIEGGDYISQPAEEKSQSN